MLSAGRTSGSKVVAIAVAGTIGMVGIGSVYLPFMADRDQMRGMDEDGGMDKKSKRQLEQYLKGQQQQQQQQAETKSAGSMWSNMKK
ncbi:expressed unknown protein [Seminavis robusta]|uniref:Uncharacterized protein n=1 Tax=Seminavis robusta TaxID=568900 RepID=A0A9N8DS17_9STRA|nr:expressed unknown protein [Seminavis robusta]|eukprot:Sro300_g111620.1 n/a (87) ;mRNA; r:12218-12478